MLNMFLPFSATFIHFQSQWHNALGVFGIGATTNMSILVVLMADICKRDQTCVCGWKSPVLVVIIRPLLVQFHSTQVAAWAAIQVMQTNATWFTLMQDQWNHIFSSVFGARHSLNHNKNIWGSGPQGISYSEGVAPPSVILRSWLWVPQGHLMWLQPSVLHQDLSHGMPWRHKPWGQYLFMEVYGFLHHVKCKTCV